MPLLDTMAAELFEERLILIVHTAAPPGDHEWRQYLELMKRWEGDREAFHPQLVYTLGGGPNSKQRALGMEIIKQKAAEPPTAVLTSSHMVRGIVTALSWIAPKNKAPIAAFAQEDFAAALALLGIDDIDPSRVRDRAHEVIGELRAKAG